MIKEGFLPVPAKIAERGLKSVGLQCGSGLAQSRHVRRAGVERTCRGVKRGRRRWACRLDVRLRGSAIFR